MMPRSLRCMARRAKQRRGRKSRATPVGMTAAFDGEARHEDPGGIPPFEDSRRKDVAFCRLISIGLEGDVFVADVGGGGGAHCVVVGGGTLVEVFGAGRASACSGTGGSAIAAAT